MANEEQKVIKLFGSYVSRRTAMAKGKTPGSVQAITNPEEAELKGAELEVVSLYQQYKSKRIPNRESIINKVMLAADAQRQQLNKVSTESVTVSVSSVEQSNESNFSSWLKSIFTTDSAGGWQTAAVFSVALVVTSVVSYVYVDQKDATPDMLASIPELLYTHREEAISHIQPNLSSQFGFSSGYEEYQIAFRSGVLLAELPLLAGAEQQSKLRQVILEANLVIRNSKDPVEKNSLDKLMQELSASSENNDRIKLIDEYVRRTQAKYSTESSQPILELGRWLEISLLSSQLQRVDNVELIKFLLQQGKIISSEASMQLPNNPALSTLLKDIQLIEVSAIDTSNGIDDFQGKLQQIKAAFL